MRYWTSHTFVEDLYDMRQGGKRAAFIRRTPLVASALDEILSARLNKTQKADPENPVLQTILRKVYEYLIAERSIYSSNSMKIVTIGPKAQDAFFGYFPVWNTGVEIMADDKRLVEETRDHCLAMLQKRKIIFGGVGNHIYDTAEYAKQMKEFNAMLR